MLSKIDMFVLQETNLESCDEGLVRGLGEHLVNFFCSEWQADQVV